MGVAWPEQAGRSRSLGIGDFAITPVQGAPTSPNPPRLLRHLAELPELLRNTDHRGNTSPTRIQRVTESLFEFMHLLASTVPSHHVIR